MLTILKTVFDQMITHAKQDLPIEACGYLAGKDGIVQKHYELTNMDASGIHFTFKPEEQFDALRDMRSFSFKPLAVYHSHPATPARPSGEDIKLAVDPSISYVIISLAGEHPETKAFRIENDQAKLEEINIITNEISHTKKETDMEYHKLDITKDKCPITFVKVKVKLAKLKKGDRLEVLLSEGEPLKNVPRSAEEQGHKVHSIKPEGQFHKVLIEKGD
ncbi:MAG: hypothetical protein GY847_30005 [Proteobacteria bacterium]|nr:hypothetical protein [Pseudomonadota bacterium]